MSKFKEGDFCYYEFEVVEIKEVLEDGRITEVSSGFFTTSSYDLSDRCAPLTLRNKVISAEFDRVSSKLHEKGHNGLNYPDIHRWLVARWIDAINTEGSEELLTIYDELYEFRDGILDVGAGVTINGVRVLR